MVKMGVKRNEHGFSVVPYRLQWIINRIKSWKEITAFKLNTKNLKILQNVFIQNQIKVKQNLLKKYEILEKKFVT